VFINSIEIQLKDLKQAVIDTIIQNKPEKIPKRVRRLRLLQYTKLISPFYTKDPIKDLLTMNDISELDIQIPDTFLDILTVDKSSIYNAENIHKRKHIRVLYEYYVSAMNSDFYKLYRERIRIRMRRVRLGFESSELTLQDFLNQFLNFFWTTFDGIAEPNPVFGHYVRQNFGTSNDTAWSHINTILRIQEIMRIFFLGSESSPDSELIQFTDGGINEYVISEGWIQKDFSEMLDLVIFYKQITINVPADSLDSLLRFILKNPENEYRVSGFFLMFLAFSINSLDTAKQGSHASTRHFLDTFSIHAPTTGFAPPAGMTLNDPVPDGDWQITVANTVNDISNQDQSHVKFMIFIGLTQISSKITFWTNRLSEALMRDETYINEQLEQERDLFRFIFEYYQNMVNRGMNTDLLFNIHGNGVYVKEIVDNMLGIFISTEGRHILSNRLIRSYFLPLFFPNEHRCIRITAYQEEFDDDLLFAYSLFNYNHFLTNLLSRYTGRICYTPQAFTNNVIFYIYGSDVISEFIPSDGIALIPTHMELRDLIIHDDLSRTILFLPTAGGSRTKGPRTRRQTRVFRKHTFKKNKRTKHTKRTYKRSSIHHVTANIYNKRS